MTDATDLVDVVLTYAERALLRFGLVEWGGPARCTDAMAVAMGFANVQDLFTESDRLIAAIESKQPLSRWDWTRALLATEIVFASDVMGSGHDWSATTGLDDVATIRTLRQLQLSLVPARIHIGPRVMDERNDG